LFVQRKKAVLLYFPVFYIDHLIGSTLYILCWLCQLSRVEKKVPFLPTSIKIPFHFPFGQCLLNIWYLIIFGTAFIHNRKNWYLITISNHLQWWPMAHPSSIIPVFPYFT
jgi:hypothetical protein